MWGLSMALVLPYLSVFMLTLGLHDTQIGLLATAGMISQVFFGLAGGIITDRMGRRLTNAVFDVIAFVIPCLIWAFAQDFWAFLAASLLNGALQVTQNAWDCLMVEDAERDQITGIYSLVRVAADCSALFAPIAAFMVAQFGMEPAVRVLFINAAVVMLAKIILLYAASHETRQGRIRMEQTRHESLWRLFVGYREAAQLLARSRGSLLALAIAALVAAVTLVNATFWQVLVNHHLHVPDAVLPFFPMVRSLLSVLFLFTLIRRLTSGPDLKQATLWGFGIYLAGQLVLVVIPAAEGEADLVTYALLGVCLLLDSFGAGMLFMLSEVTGDGAAAHRGDARCRPVRLDLRVALGDGPHLSVLADQRAAPDRCGHHRRLVGRASHRAVGRGRVGGSNLTMDAAHVNLACGPGRPRYRVGGLQQHGRPDRTRK